jgi:hypothetical protein
MIIRNLFFFRTLLWLACAEYLLSGVASAHLRVDYDAVR